MRLNIVLFCCKFYADVYLIQTEITRLPLTSAQSVGPPRPTRCQVQSICWFTARFTLAALDESSFESYFNILGGALFGLQPSSSSLRTPQDFITVILLILLSYLLWSSFFSGWTPSKSRQCVQIFCSKYTFYFFLAQY